MLKHMGALYPSQLKRSFHNYRIPAHKAAIYKKHQLILIY